MDRNDEILYISKAFNLDKDYIELYLSEVDDNGVSTLYNLSDEAVFKGKTFDVLYKAYLEAVQELSSLFGALHMDGNKI